MYELRQWLKERTHKRSPWGEKLDTNGYAKSLFDTEDGVCFICGIHADTARHELFGGVADRPTSKAVGLWLNLCPHCHALIHKDEEESHKTAQRMFEYHYSHEEFLELFGRNYL